jgi:hypothetical protein
MDLVCVINWSLYRVKDGILYCNALLVKVAVEFNLLRQYINGVLMVLLLGAVLVPVTKLRLGFVRLLQIN